MWKNSNGFSMFESIAAFSIWCLAAVVLLPSMMYITMERKNDSKELTGIKVLNTIIKEAAFNNQKVSNGLKMYEGEKFTVKLEEGSDQRVCIQWEEKTNRTRKICMQVP